MANKRKNTIFQGLSNILNGRDPKNPRNFDISKDNLSKVSAGEYDLTKLEKQQEVYLAHQWKKIDSELYQKAVFYEPTRIASYYDYESMEFCLAGETKIATPDGFITIEELANKGRDHEFIVYSYDHNKKQVVPAMARNAHYTRDELTYKITFDDGNHIIATYEHRLMRRDGSFARVKELSVGDSMMPFYRKSFYNNQNYNWVYSCNSDVGHNGWVSEHNMIAEWAYRPINENEEVHHIDFNGKNNLPDNLKIMDRSEHRAYHARLNNEKLWSNPDYRKKMSEVARRKGKMSWGGKRSGKNNPAYFRVPWDNITNAAEKYKTLKGTAKALGISHTKLQREITYAGYKDWSTFLEAYGIEKSKYSTARATGDKLKINHKIVSIEEYGVIPVYDLTVPEYKNFATDTIFSHNTPEISAALDIFMEEATTPNEEGKILEIYSEQDRIRAELEDLFYNRLDINTNLPSWVRNTVKYGDNFLYNKIIPKEGFVGVTQLPNIEITRSEPDFRRVSNVGDIDNDGSHTSTRFHWKNMNIDFNSFEVSHFRLVGDDRRLPYGTCLKYDTRVDVENGVKEIQHIKKGDMVWSFDTKTQQRVLSPVLDTVNSGEKQCFKVSTKHYDFEASEEHRIMVVDDQDNFTYKNVCDLTVGDRLVCSRHVLSDKKYKIDKSKPSENKNGWFNNIDLIPDYVDGEFAQLLGFLYGDGWIPSHGNSVAIALGVESEINEYYISLLEKYSGKKCKIVNNDRQAVCNSKLLKTILTRLGFNGTATTKRLPDWLYNVELEIQQYFVAGLIEADGWVTCDQWVCATHIELANNQLIKDVKILLSRMGYKCGSVRTRLRKGQKIFDRIFNKVHESSMITFYDTKKKQEIKHETRKRLTDNYLIQPIKSITKTGVYTTYDIYVENENHNFYANGVVVHNSILEKARRIWKQLLLSEDAMLVYRITRAPERRVHKVYVGNMDDKDVDAYVDKVANEFKRNQIVDSTNGQVDTRYNHLAVDQDIFVPVRTENAQTPIDTLAGASNLGEISDIEYIQQKLFAAMRIPKAFLGFEDAFGDGKNLAILDIRFARAVHRIQQSIVMELNRMAIMHLYMRGYHDDLENFQLGMVSPSTQADLLKLERWREKIGLYMDAVGDAGNGFGAMSMTKAQKDILGFTEDEIRLDIQRQAVEKAASEEMKLISEVIRQSGVFKDLYDIYQIDSKDLEMGGGGDERESDSAAGGFSAGGGDLGGGDLGDGDLDLGGIGDDTEGDTNDTGDDTEELMEGVDRLLGRKRKNPVIHVKPKHKSTISQLNENVINPANKILKAETLKNQIRENLNNRKNHVDNKVKDLMNEINNMLDDDGNIKLNQ